MTANLNVENPNVVYLLVISTPAWDLGVTRPDGTKYSIPMPEKHEARAFMHLKKARSSYNIETRSGRPAMIYAGSARTVTLYEVNLDGTVEAMDSWTSN